MIVFPCPHDDDLFKDSCQKDPFIDFLEHDKGKICFSLEPDHFHG